MKTVNGISILGGLVLTLAYWYWQGDMFDKNLTGGHTQVQGDFSTELALVKMEMGELRKGIAELVQIKHKIAALETKVLNHTVLLPTVKKTTAMVNPSEFSGMVAETPDELARRQSDYNAKNQGQMDTVFLAEPAEQPWALETTQLVSRFFDQEKAADLNVSDIQCRKTLCKVELTQVNQARAANQLALHFPLYVGKALSQARYFQVQNEKGTVDVTIYLARNGYDLPSEI